MLLLLLLMLLLLTLSPAIVNVDAIAITNGERVCIFRERVSFTPYTHSVNVS